MKILRKLLSFMIINAAVFMITLSFLAWVLDARLLNAAALTSAFDHNKLAAAIANAIPSMFVPDTPNDKPATQQEIVEVQNKIKAVATEPYIQTKLNGMITNTIGYIKTGNPQPTLDLTDFGSRLQSATGEPVPAEIADKLSKPVNLLELANDSNTQPRDGQAMPPQDGQPVPQNNKQSDGPKLDKIFPNIRKSYDILKKLIIIAPLVALVLLVLEWLLTPSGKRLGKTAYIFIAAGLWGIFWWVIISRAPDIIVTKVEASPDIEKAWVDVVKALLKSLSSVLSQSFMQFGMACLAVAVAVLVARTIMRRRNAPKVPAGAKPAPVPVAVAQGNAKKR